MGGAALRPSFSGGENSDRLADAVLGAKTSGEPRTRVWDLLVGMPPPPSGGEKRMGVDAGGRGAGVPPPCIGDHRGKDGSLARRWVSSSASSKSGCRCGGVTGWIPGAGCLDAVRRCEGAVCRPPLAGHVSSEAEARNAAKSSRRDDVERKPLHCCCCCCRPLAFRSVTLSASLSSSSASSWSFVTSTNSTAGPASASGTWAGAMPWPLSSVKRTSYSSGSSPSSSS